MHPIRTTLALLPLLLATSSAHGYLIKDPDPSMTWPEMLHAELVVEATLQIAIDVDHPNVQLKILRVFKGDSVKPGDTLPITLEHWYHAHPPATLRYWYEQENTKPTPLQDLAEQNCSPSADYGDAQKPLVYFFPSAKQLTLKQYGQVQPHLLAEDWAAAVAPNPKISAFLRIVQPLDRDVYRAALAEVHTSRDPESLHRLLAWMFDTREGYGEANQILPALGDVHGDLFKPLLAYHDAISKNQDWLAEPGRLAVILDPAAGFTAMSDRALNGPGKGPALAALGWIPTQQSLDFLLTRLAAGDDSQNILFGLVLILHMKTDQSFVYPDATPAQITDLRAHALPQLQSLAALPALAPIKQSLLQTADRITANELPAH